MSRMIVSSLAAVFAASAFVGAGPQPLQSPSPPAQAQQSQQDQEVKLTGCLVQGSGPLVFILDNAKMDERSTNEKAKTFVLAVGAEDVTFAKSLNHKVTITGSAEVKTPPVPPAGQKVAEKDLPKLSAKSVLSVADTCSP